MGRPPDVLAGDGVAVAVPTGGRLPEGADAVVMSERAEATDEGVEIGQRVLAGATWWRPEKMSSRGRP